MLNFNTVCTAEPRVTVDGVVFRVESTDSGFKTCDSGISGEWENPVTGAVETMYGILTGVYFHKLYEGENSPSVTVAKVRWLEVIDHQGAYGGRVAVVRENKRLGINNGHHQYVNVRALNPSHVVFWKRQAWTDTCTELVAIERAPGRSFNPRSQKY